MKRVLFLFGLAALFLAACGLGEAAQGSTASLSQNNSSNQQADINIDDIVCDLYPSRNLKQEEGHAVCQLIIRADAAKLGFEGGAPATLISSGVFSLPTDDNLFKETVPLQARGKGRMSTCPVAEIPESGLFYPCGLPVFVVTAEFEDSPLAGAGPVELTVMGAVMNFEKMVLENVWPEPGDEPYIIFMDKTYAWDSLEAFHSQLVWDETSWLSITDCQGFLLPDSPIASIIMIGELRDGQSVTVAGTAAANDLKHGTNRTEFSCQGESDAEIMIDEETSLTAIRAEASIVFQHFPADAVLTIFGRQGDTLISK